MKNSTQLSVAIDLQEFKPVRQPFETTAEITCRYNYSPIIFENNYREAKNFKSASLCILDFDGNLSISDAKKIFEEYQVIIVTTKSHQTSIKNGKPIEKTDRFRIILKFDRPITNSKEYQVVMSNVISRFNSDPACADGARFFYPNPYQGVWVSKGTKLIEVAKYNTPTQKKSFSSLSIGHYENELEDDLKITDKNENTLTATQWVKELQKAEDRYTHTIFCPHPQHEDKHPSAFITLSRYRRDEIYIWCHKCGSLGTYPIQKLKINTGEK